jgi:hypothetical protein
MVKRVLAAIALGLLWFCSAYGETGGWSKPADVLVYYGWVSSFNYHVNLWSNEAVSQDMEKYDIIVLGNGVADPSHGDYANASWIIARIKVLNPSCVIFGYVTVNQKMNTWKKAVDDWVAIGAHGIFADEAGYDFGKTRDEFNARIDDVHGHGLIVMANAWHPEHVLGTEDGVGGYYNSVHNPDEDPSSLNSNDYIYLESLAVNTAAYSSSGGYELRSQWLARKATVEKLRQSFSVGFVGGCVISNTNTDAQKLFDFAYASATMLQLEAMGSSDVHYGASSAKVEFWERPGYLE